MVIGLGPGGTGSLTEATVGAIDAATRRFVRTTRHPGADQLEGFESFDHLYDDCATFDDVYGAIVEALVKAATEAGDTGSVLYAVPGSPWIAEQTVVMLVADPRIELRVMPALSFLDLAWARLGVDPLARSVRLVDGLSFATEAAGERGPLLVAQCYSKDVLSEIKLAVEAPDGLTATVLFHLGLDDEAVFEVAWDELDRVVEPDHLTSLWIEHLAAPVAGELVALEQLVRTLRARCPWDAKQTHGSLSAHLLEESYEVLDSISELEAATGADDPARLELAVEHLCEELGDVLFQVYFHARLGAEEGRFDLDDIARGIHDKLVHRHPHVFGDLEVHDPETVVANWEVIKRSEKQRSSVTEGIPMALPALALAVKLQRKAEAVGLDLASTVDVSSILGGQGDAAEQIGAALFALVQEATQLGVDPEQALRALAVSLRDDIVAFEHHDQPTA